MSRLLIAALCALATVWSGIEVYRHVRPTVVTCGISTPAGVAVRFIWTTQGARVVGDSIVSRDGVYRMGPGEVCLIGDMPELRSGPARDPSARAL